MSDRKHQEHYLEAIHPMLVAFLDSIEEWADAHRLKVGWMLHWAFLKLDSYLDQREVSGDDPTSRYFELSDILGKEVQPRVVQKASLQDWGVISFELPGLSIRADLYRPLVTTEKDYRKQVEDAFKRELNQYLTTARRSSSQVLTSWRISSGPSFDQAASWRLPTCPRQVLSRGPVFASQFPPS